MGWMDRVKIGKQGVDLFTREEGGGGVDSKQKVEQWVRGNTKKKKKGKRRPCTVPGRPEEHTYVRYAGWPC